MATQARYAQAVKENRMVSVRESTIRKTIGFALLGFITLGLYAKVCCCALQVPLCDVTRRRVFCHGHCRASQAYLGSSCLFLPRQRWV